jgi:hypothetical protein
MNVVAFIFKNKHGFRKLSSATFKMFTCLFEYDMYVTLITLEQRNLNYKLRILLQQNSELNRIYENEIEKDESFESCIQHFTKTMLSLKNEKDKIR